MTTLNPAHIDADVLEAFLADGLARLPAGDRQRLELAYESRGRVDVAIVVSAGQVAIVVDELVVVRVPLGAVARGRRSDA